MFLPTKPFSDKLKNHDEPTLRIGRKVPKNAVNLAYYYNPTATDTEKVLLSLLLQNDNCTQYLYALGRKTKEKLLPYIAESYPIKINEDDFYHFILLINRIIN